MVDDAAPGQRHFVSKLEGMRVAELEPRVPVLVHADEHTAAGVVGCAVEIPARFERNLP